MPITNESKADNSTMIRIVENLDCKGVEYLIKKYNLTRRAFTRITKVSGDTLNLWKDGMPMRYTSKERIVMAFEREICEDKYLFKKYAAFK